VTPPAPPARPRSWLAAIDLQHVFADSASPWSAPRFAEIVSPVARLVDAFGDRSAFTRFVAPDRPAGAWRAYYADWPFALVAADEPLYELVPAFAGHAHGALAATTFGKWDVLRDRIGPVDRLVVCGVSTDCCVLSTVLAAADAGVEVLVAADACAGATDDTHRQALDLMSLYGPLVRVVSTAEVLSAELGSVELGSTGLDDGDR
jgi:nicotinamidase-related amidase